MFNNVILIDKNSDTFTSKKKKKDCDTYKLPSI